MIVQYIIFIDTISILNLYSCANSIKDFQLKSCILTQDSNYWIQEETKPKPIFS